jgi:hypothetical protein
MDRQRQLVVRGPDFEKLAVIATEYRMDDPLVGVVTSPYRPD